MRTLLDMQSCWWCLPMQMLYASGVQANFSHEQLGNRKYGLELSCQNKKAVNAHCNLLHAVHGHGPLLSCLRLRTYQDLAMVTACAECLAGVVSLLTILIVGGPLSKAKSITLKVLRKLGAGQFGSVYEVHSDGSRGHNGLQGLRQDQARPKRLSSGKALLQQPSWQTLQLTHSRLIASRLRRKLRCCRRSVTTEISTSSCTVVRPKRET